MSLLIRKATWHHAAARPGDFPQPNRPSFAFIGRSNVGKSSLINMLLGRDNLARTSKRPGKTQLIHHYLINEAWYLVDLPGYGWAQVSKALRARWESCSRGYLRANPELRRIFLLVDSRHAPQQIDLAFAQFLTRSKLPWELVFTKVDKLRKAALPTMAKRFEEAYAPLVSFPLRYHFTTSVRKLGREELLEVITAQLP